MTNILIVAKTRIRTRGYGIAGVRLDYNENVRLLPSNGFIHPLDSPLEVGSIWKLMLQDIPLNEKTAPFIESIRIVQGHPVGRMTETETKDYVLTHLDAPYTSPEGLFSGRVNINEHNKAVISPYHGVPLYGSGFWRFEKDLIRKNKAKDARYIMVEDESGKCQVDFPYLGTQEPVECIPAGSLLHFTLSNWWGAVCWLLLSRWYL